MPLANSIYGKTKASAEFFIQKIVLELSHFEMLPLVWSKSFAH